VSAHLLYKGKSYLKQFIMYITRKLKVLPSFDVLTRHTKHLVSFWIVVFDEPTIETAPIQTLSMFSSATLDVVNRICSNVCIGFFVFLKGIGTSHSAIGIVANNLQFQTNDVFPVSSSVCSSTVFYVIEIVFIPFIISTISTNASTLSL